MTTDFNERVRQAIGKEIAKLRADSRMTQRELATLTGYSQSNIARIESGKYSVGLDVLANICDHLGAQVQIYMNTGVINNFENEFAAAIMSYADGNDSHFRRIIGDYNEEIAEILEQFKSDWKNLDHVESEEEDRVSEELLSSYILKLRLNLKIKYRVAYTVPKNGIVSKIQGKNELYFFYYDDAIKCMDHEEGHSPLRTNGYVNPYLTPEVLWQECTRLEVQAWMLSGDKPIELAYLHRSDGVYYTVPHEGR